MATALAASTRSVADLELSADQIDPQAAAQLYREHGCFVVRGLMRDFADQVCRDILACVEQAFAIEGEPGDAIVFHSKTIHGSKPNYSDGPRPVFIHRYRAANDYAIINAATAAKRADAEKHSAEAKKENQRGSMVRGFRQWDSDRLA